ncbi:MAG TPA: dienelactone hydrolase family protein [Vicinamibacterales bacterium]|nr:dienelactone hydrolase family protein [Vicinamibacterales bacterium]
MTNPTDPHQGQPVLHYGAPIESARRVGIFVHGRGASAEDILGIAPELGTNDVAYLAPQAAGNTWYPHSFLSPIPQNEPGLTSALNVIAGLVAKAASEGHTSEHVIILGFSQGACLALEFAARHAKRYAAVVALSGGVIGPPGTPRNYSGSMADTPVFLGCSDVDPHIPLERVHESAEVFRGMGARVDERIYKRMGHTINADELAAVRELVRG